MDRKNDIQNFEDGSIQMKYLIDTFSCNDQ